MMKLYIVIFVLIFICPVTIEANYISDDAFVPLTEDARVVLEDIWDITSNGEVQQELIEAEQKLATIISSYRKYEVFSGDTRPAQENIIAVLKYIDEYCLYFIAAESIDAEGRKNTRTAITNVNRRFINYSADIRISEIKKKAEVSPRGVKKMQPPSTGLWTDICSSSGNSFYDSYCKSKGKSAYNAYGGPKNIELGTIVGVAWKQKGSLISTTGRTSPRDAFYYIIDDGSGAPFLRQCREIEPRR